MQSSPSPNPYESPHTTCVAEKVCAEPVYGSRWQAAYGEAWRGVKIGFKFCVPLWGICLLIWIGIVALVQFRFWSGLHLTPVEILEVFGLAVLEVLAGSALFTAVPGALIMGLIGAIRWRNPEKIGSGGEEGAPAHE